MLKTNGHGVLAQDVSTSRRLDLGKVSLIPPGTKLSSFMLHHKLLGRCTQKSRTILLPLSPSLLKEPGSALVTRSIRQAALVLARVLTQLEQGTGRKPSVLLEIL